MTDSKLPFSVRLKHAPLAALLAFLGMLPLPVLYALAGIVTLAARYVARYRLRLVRTNIATAFPDATERRHRKIVNGFYRRLGEYVAETIHTPYMSAREMKRRMRFEDTEIIDRLFDEGKDIVIYTSHFGNWEWLASVGRWCSRRDATYAFIYRPLKNRWFDRYFLRLRSRLGEAVKMHSAFRTLLTWRKSGTPFICGFLSDQKPSHHSSTLDVDFFGHPTPFMTGAEEIARKMDAAVCYFDNEILSRGHYKARIRLIAPSAAAEAAGEITRRYTQLLQQTISRSPEAYLWSHNRWRMNRKNPMPL